MNSYVSRFWYDSVVKSSFALIVWINSVWIKRSCLMLWVSIDSWWNNWFFNSGSSRTGIFVTCCFFYNLLVNLLMTDFVLDPLRQQHPGRRIRNEREHARTRRHARADSKERLQERANEIQLLPLTPLKLACYYSNTLWFHSSACYADNETGVANNLHAH